MRKALRIVVAVVIITTVSFPLFEVFDPIAELSSPSDWSKIYLWEDPILLALYLCLTTLWLINLIRPYKITRWSLIVLSALQFLGSISLIAFPSPDFNILSGAFSYVLLPILIASHTIFCEKPVSKE